MSTYSYEERLNAIRQPDPAAIKNNELEFANFYQKLKTLEEHYKKAGGKLVIVGDYDCDGICSSSILHKIFPDAKVVLGDRYKYGYGIPTDLPIGENDLVICTDVGTNDVDTLKTISQTYHACPVIIDHHEFSVEKMKKYKYLLNFKRSEDKETRPDYCATGLAYKLYEIDYRATHKDNEKELNTVKALAAIGTIGDIVSVNNPYDDNRRIILDGFEAIRNADFDKDNFDETLGYILSKCGITENPYTITTNTIQMNVAPLFNAPGRMQENGANEFFDALNSPFYNERGHVIKETLMKIDGMFALNDRRKEMKKNITSSDAFKELVNNDKDIKIYVNDGIPMGLNGIIASNLTELSGKPAIVFCKSPSGTYVGSGRNADGYPSILEEVKKSGIETLKLGGHDDAFGLSVDPSKIQDTVQKLENHYKSVVHEDVDIPHLDVTLRKGASFPISFDDMMRLEPFGNDFPKLRVELHGKLSDFGASVTGIKSQDNPPEYKKFQINGVTFTTFSAGAVLDELNQSDQPVQINGELNINCWGKNSSLQVIYDTCEERSREKDLDIPELP